MAVRQLRKPRDSEGRITPERAFPTPQPGDEGDPNILLDDDILLEAEQNGVDLKWRIRAAKRAMTRSGHDKELTIRRMYKIPDNVALTGESSNQ